VIGERSELDKMVHNLVSNAVKYTPTGGAVTVACSVEGGDAVLVFQDEGIGIAADDRARLFDEFFRSSDPAAQARPGTGLGLAIVRRVVEHHHGTVDVESELGAGSTFTVRIPRRRHVLSAPG
jgi:signal transduction histidine kinase